VDGALGVARRRALLPLYETAPPRRRSELLELKELPERRRADSRRTFRVGSEPSKRRLAASHWLIWSL
jgi:hypothetical protein